MFLLSKSHPFCIEALLLAIHLGAYMPVWPFKKKVAEAEEIPTEIVSYQRGDNSAGEVIDDTSHKEAADYQAAMALFSSGVAKKDTESKSKDLTWVSHTDGYHYKKNPDGSFQETPHVKDAEGNYAPYS